MTESSPEAMILLPSSPDKKETADNEINSTRVEQTPQVNVLLSPILGPKMEEAVDQVSDNQVSVDSDFPREPPKKPITDDVQQQQQQQQQQQPTYKTKYHIPSTESSSFDSLSCHDRHSISSNNNKNNEVPSNKPTNLPLVSTTLLQPKTVVEIDTSVTPRAALSDAVMENLDFEILPDEDDDDDDENGGDSEDETIDDDALVRNMLQSVKEISLEGDTDDDENDDVDDSEYLKKGSMDEADVSRSSTPAIETSKSLSFDSPSKQLFQNSTMSAPSSPVAARPTAEATDNTGETSFTDASLQRRRISGFFTNASPRRLGSTSKATTKISSSDQPIVSSSSNDLVESTTSDDKSSKRGQRLTTLIRTTMGAIKDGIKSDTSSVSVSVATSSMDALGESTTAAATTPGPTDEQDSSSDESSYDEDEQWLEDEAQIFDDDIDQVVDCGNFTPLPISFLNMPPDMYDYLDLDLVTNIQNQDISTFAWEHHLFVKGLLQLLFERDMIGVEDDIFDSSNITKMGVLRKKHAKSGWRVKYVEVRKGNLTYFADKQNEKRRTVHLRKRSCNCRGEDLSFELIVDGGKRLLWMAKSEKECQGWIRAINQAMIGETEDVRDAPFDVSTYQTAIDDFQAVQASMKDAKTRQECLISINSLLYRQTSTSALRVPMKWIRETVIKSSEMSLEPLNAPDDVVKYTIRDFWDSLCSTSIVLNGYLVEANSLYSGERIIGALSRCILEFDKVDSAQGFDGALNSLKRGNQDADSFITEVEAVSFARQILSGALQSMARGDMQAAVERLFLNENVASVRLESSEPLHVDISFAGDDFSDDEPRTSDFVGWIETKSKKSKEWRKRYFVASEGVLSYFERADPRPYRLRGQIVLIDAKVTQLEGNVLSIEVGSKERLLRFEDRSNLVQWKAVFEKENERGEIIIGEFETSSGDHHNTTEDQTAETLQQQESSSPKSSNRLRSRTGSSEDARPGNLRGVRDVGAKLLKNAADGVGRAKAHANRAAAEGMKRARNATDAGMKSIRTGAGMFIRGVTRTSTANGRRRPTSDMFLTSTRNLTAKSGKRDPTVQAVVEIDSVFKVISRAPSTDDNQEEDEEDMLIVRVKLYQAFLLSGGQTGRLASGDELLLMEFSKAEGVEDVAIEALEPPASL
ncbi:PH domain containing protein [Nitzschia inconspicua]|uniref:PH domain containing protein n=1 Tax=Nitzschia inconspicua TaxID=303405 RepID=A0A9K3LKZ9_9STRA|nr:PH domain containing protein [Nitzschia inconspicua]